MNASRPDATDVDPARLVFVGGLHRSGTTPLARVLAEHPEIAGLTGTGVFEDEGAHLQRTYPAPSTLGGMGRFARSARAHMTAGSPLATSDTARSLLTAWLPYWDTSRRLLVEKSPGNMLMGGLLQAVFPGSALVVVVRHPVAVAMAMQKWNPPVVARDGRRHQTLVGYVDNWVRAHAILESDSSSLTRLRVLRYEDLVADPQRELDRLGDFLGVTSPIPPGGVRGGLGQDYQRRWDAMAGGRAWQRRSRTSIESRFGAAMGRWGYDPDRLTAAGPVGGVGLLGT